VEKARAYRDGLGDYPTGVVLITHMLKGSARAMTVNSFASVSLEPRLILWSLAKDSARYSAFLNAAQFGVNVLAADQHALATACAQSDDLEASGARWAQGPGGAPLVADTLARFECRREAVYDGGDHDIIIGRVMEFDRPRQAPALVFHRSAFAAANGGA
jgi:flavin reductase (DIM6/NTAB) family NADH-FMN oxidoreductase RutF